MTPCSGMKLWGSPLHQPFPPPISLCREPSPGCSQVPEVPQYPGVSPGQGRQCLLVLNDAGRQRRGGQGSSPGPLMPGAVGKARGEGSERDAALPLPRLCPQYSPQPGLGTRMELS